MSERPSPDEILARIKAEERAFSGKLKIFLGAAPGVGKTFSMLEAARARRAEGLDVVAGVIETHGRKETEKELSGLEILPRKKIDYHNADLLEFDLDAALSRAPALILIDELAHSNAPGSRHAKRWQDIQELLARGIDVYTTLNIQHLESLNDVVAQITGVTVRETVPDSIIEKASSVELVDLPPEELLERLKEGKVYLGEQARIAAKNFFKPGNLTALRELALRVTAAGVSAQVQTSRQKESSGKTWPTSERLLVCVGPGPGSARIVRAAKRMAASLRADWAAVFVEAARSRFSKEKRDSAMGNLRLAEQLGGETLTLSGSNVAEEIITLARARNVTKIIIGKSLKNRFSGWVFGNLVDELIQRSGEIEVCVVLGDSGKTRVQPAQTPQEEIPWRDYAVACFVFVLCTGASFLMRPSFALSNIIMVYLLGTVLVSARGTRGPAVFMSILSVVTFDFLFVPPRFSFAISDTQYFLTFLVMLTVALIISNLTVAIRQQAEIARINERRTASLHALSRRLAASRGTETILAVTAQHMAEVFDGWVFIFLPDETGRVAIRASAPDGDLAMDVKELNIAQWVYDIGQMAGFGTQTLPFIDALYMPMRGANASMGVLRLRPKDKGRLLIAEQLLLAEAFTNQAALALEVDRLQEMARQSQVEIETERLRNSLLSSVSHDLRTPLAAIIGSATSLLQMNSWPDAKAVRELLQNIYDEGLSLSRLVNNLLQATRLDSGAVLLQKEKIPIEEVLESAVNKIEKQLEGKPFHVQIPENLPLAPIDGVLFEQVFINLIDNAVKYTPPDSPIDISVSIQEGNLLVEVADRGQGLSSEESQKVFDKFYRGEKTARKSGAGLGLAICRAIVQAHGGKIWVENRAGGGASFKMTIPLADETPLIQNDA